MNQDNPSRPMPPRKISVPPVISTPSSSVPPQVQQSAPPMPESPQPSPVPSLDVFPHVVDQPPMDTFTGNYNNLLQTISQTPALTKKYSWLVPSLIQLSSCHSQDLAYLSSSFQSDVQKWQGVSSLYEAASLRQALQQGEQKVREMQGFYQLVIEQARNQHNHNIALYNEELRVKQAQLQHLEYELLETADTLAFQAVSLNEFYNPAQDSPELKKQLGDTIAQRKKLIKERKAITAVSGFTFNGSKKEGDKFVKDFCDLMLAAYNAQVENAIVASDRNRSIEPALKKIDKAFSQVEKLGTMISCRITDKYHRLRKKELELAFKHRAAVLREKEEERERRAEMQEAEAAERAARKEEERLAKEEAAILREQRRREQELEQERLKLERELEQARISGLLKEQERLQNVIALMRKGDPKLEAIKERLTEVKEAKQKNSGLLANNKAGYVYVISNVGSFGEGVVKIGLTRRVNPEHRVDELGDASVPFRFETHVIHFSEDAVSLEKELHRRFAERAVNKVNPRKEFFRVRPEEVMEAMEELSNGAVVTFDLEPISPEYFETKKLEGIRV